MPVRTRIILLTIALLAMILLPPILSHEIRSNYTESASHLRAKLVQPDILLIGDSITRGGKPWGPRLSGDPFSAVTYAFDGYTAARLVPYTDPESWGFRPRFVAYMAGTNDAHNPEISREAFVRDQLANIDRLIGSGAKVIVMLSPPAARPAHSARVAAFNRALLAALGKRKVIVVDLWPELARDGLMQPQFSDDGVHFNEAGYAIWARHLRAAISRNSPE